MAKFIVLEKSGKDCIVNLDHVIWVEMFTGSDFEKPYYLVHMLGNVTFDVKKKELMERLVKALGKEDE